MQLKPDETPDMYVGEKRRVSVNVAGVAGVNSISSVEVTNDKMTIESASSSGLNVTFFLTATQQGNFYTKIAPTLSSGETPTGYLRTLVKPDPTSNSDTTRYDDED